MRRTARSILILVLMSAAACSSPTMRLSRQFHAGDLRFYALTSTSKSVFNVPGVGGTEATTLTADMRLAVLKGAKQVRITITPTSFTRDGKKADPPPEQTVTVDIGDDGSILPLDTPNGLLGGSDDVETLFGGPLPSGRAHVGQRFASSGQRRSRIASLRYIDGYRCAVIASTSVRPVTRQRQTAQGTLTLTGSETGATTSAFAFDRGFVVSIDSNVHADLSAQQGTVAVDSATSVKLLPKAPAPVPAPNETGSPTATTKATVKPKTTGSPAPRRS